MAAIKFLDNTGLAYLWSKIKAWANAAFAAISHSHGNITNDGKLGTASRAVITDSNKKIAVSSVTSTELGYVSGVTSAIQTQLNGKAASSHNQASNTINVMTGYSKPNSGSAIATSDSLNSAIGKLEAKVDAYDDSNYVHLTGNENVAGIKTFSSELISTSVNSFRMVYGAYGSFWRNDGSNTYLLVTASNDQYGTWTTARPIVVTNSTGVCSINGNAATSTKLATNRKLWGNNFNGSADVADCITINPGVQTSYAPILKAIANNGTNSITQGIMYLGKYINSYGVNLGVGGSGNTVIGSGESSYAQLNELSTDSSEQMYVCSDYNIYFKVNCDNIANAKTVTLNSNADLSGITKLTANDVITRKGNKINYTFRGQDTSITKGTVPSDNQKRYSCLDFCGVNADDYRYRIAMVEFQYMVDKTSFAGLWAYKCDTEINGTAEYIGIYYPPSGNPYTYAPTPATSDNSTKIATTAFVKAQGYLTSHQSLSNYVTLNGTQSISGTKTFTADLTIKRSQPNLFIRNDDYTWNTTPSASCNWWIEPRDANNKWLGSRSWYISTDKNSCAYTSVISAYEDADIRVSLYYEKNGNKFFRPESNGDMYLGGASFRWKQLYASTSSINTSDKRLKQDIQSIPNDILDTWDKIEWQQFKFNEAIDKKSTNARIHTGLIAQDIESVFKKEDKDISKYGLFCYDEWDANPGVKTEDGRILEKEREAGSVYSIRYEEALCMEAAYQRRKNKILENRISELETQVQNMLQVLESLKGA